MRTHSSLRWLVALLLAISLVGVGCAARRPDRLMDRAASASTDAKDHAGARVQALWAARTRDGAPVDFCIGPGDLLEITVFHFPEMTGLRTRVSSSGFITLPLLGDIQAAGLTARALQDRTAARLREGIMRNPNVTVFVAEYTSQQVSVTGAVARPGLIPLTREHRTVSHLIAEAGGLTEQAGGKILFYPARGSGCASGADPVRIASARPPADIAPIEVDTNAEYEPPSENPLVLPVVGGDAIVVNRGRYFVDGWVNTPGAYDISPGVTALGALSAAGGALFPADLTRVAILRSVRSGSKKEITVNLKAITGGDEKDITLQSGDVVKVPPSPIRMIPYSGYWFMTNVVRVGAGLSLTGL